MPNSFLAFWFVTTFFADSFFFFLIKKQGQYLNFFHCVPLVLGLLLFVYDAMKHMKTVWSVSYNEVVGVLEVAPEYWLY